MTEKKSGRPPAAFSREFARKLNGVISEHEAPPTGRDLARALYRNDGYVSERKNGKRAWSIDDLDVIAGELKTTGLDLMLTVLGRMDPPESGKVLQFPVPSGPPPTVTDEELIGQPSVATPEPRNDVEGTEDPEET
jgi:hypothetical protein